MCVTDSTDAQNRISSRVFDGGAGPVATAMSYDAAGNLTCDGTYFYQYDAWNRVVQINAKQANPATGPPQPDASKFLKHFTYDGQGRLIRVQSPYPDAATWASTGTNGGLVRSERFYYDGVRRVQELFVDPVSSIDVALGSDDGEVQQSAQDALDGSPAPPNTGQSPGNLENTQSGLDGEGGDDEGGDGGVGGGDPTGPPAEGVRAYVEREHVWALARSGRGRDGHRKRRKRLHRYRSQHRLEPHGSDEVHL